MDSCASIALSCKVNSCNLFFHLFYSRKAPTSISNKGDLVKDALELGMFIRLCFCGLLPYQSQQL